MSASDPDVCNVYNDPRFRKSKAPEAKGAAAGITAEGFREFCRNPNTRAPGWPELDAAAASLEGGERMRRLVEAAAAVYEATGYPRCPVCGVFAVRGVDAPAHDGGCEFGRFLEERRAAAMAAPAPPDAEAIVPGVSRQVDSLFDEYAWPPSAEWLWRLHAAHMRAHGWTIVTAGGLQVDGPTQREAFRPICDVLSRLAPARAADGPARAAAWPPSAEYVWRLHAAHMRARGWTVMTLGGLQVDGPTQQEAFGPICDALSRLDAARTAGGPDGAAATEFPGAEYLWRLHAACMRSRGWIVADASGLQVDGPAQQEAFEPIRNVFRGAAARMDAVVAELVGSLEGARVACHSSCRRNNHFTSDCPSTHFVKRPCTCRCDCPAGPHNAAIDAAIAMVPKAPKAPA